MTYVPVGSSFTFAGSIVGQGNWTVAAPYYGNRQVEEDMFEVRISHGRSPRSDTYGYCVVPSDMEPKTAVRYVRKNVKIISDSQVAIGSVRIDVNWNEKIINIREI